MLLLLRCAALLQVAGVVAQAVLAGQFLSGLEFPVRLHEIGGWLVVVVAAVQLLLGAAALRNGAPLWIPISAAGIFLAGLLQVGTGYGRFPMVHVPLGVVLFGAVLCQALGAFRPRQKGSLCG